MAQASKAPREEHGRRRSATRRAKAAVKPARRGGNAGHEPVAAAKRAASKTKRAAKEKAVSAAPRLAAGLAARRAGKLAGRTPRKATGRASAAGSRLLESAAQRTAQAGAAAAHAARRTAKDRLPIQRSIDIAVPLHVAWEEWMELDTLPEGVGTVREVERDGDRLTGITGATEGEWTAEILDERDEQSFAWRSHEGSDCAGLVTFHQLAERLTRIELNLDVVPTGPAEAVALATGLAGRRAERELRRFKARVELISPDVYETDQD